MAELADAQDLGTVLTAPQPSARRRTTPNVASVYAGFFHVVGVASRTLAERYQESTDTTTDTKSVEPPFALAAKAARSIARHIGTATQTDAQLKREAKTR